MPDNLSRVRQSLISAGYNPPSEEQFRQDMQNDDNLRRVHQSLRRAGYTPPEYEQFRKDIGFTDDKDVVADNNFTISESELKAMDKQPDKQPTKPRQQTASTSTSAKTAPTATAKPAQVPSSAFKLDTKDLNTWRNPWGKQQSTTQDNEQFTREDPNKDKTVSDAVAALKGDEQAAKRIGRDKALRQQRDRIDYAIATKGEELQGGFDPESEIVAPTVERDEQGNIVMGEDGKPVTSITTDPARVKANVTEHAKVKEWEYNSLKSRRERAQADLEDIMDKMEEMKESGNYDAKEYSNYLLAREETLDLLHGLDLEEAGGEQGFFNGIGEAFTHGKIWAFGLDKLADAMNRYELYRKITSGQELNESEKALAAAYIAADEEEQKLDENSTFAYRAGRMTAEMLPFAAGIMLTGGGANIAGKVSQYVGKYAAKATNKATRYVIKATGAVLGDMLGGAVMANTIGAPRTAADIMYNRMGNLVYDPEGNFSFEGGKSVGKSIYQGEMSNTLEYSTELMGENLWNPFAERILKEQLWSPFMKKMFGNTEKIRGQLFSIMEGRFGADAVKSLKRGLEKTQKVMGKAGLQEGIAEPMEEEINFVLGLALGSDDKDEAVANFLNTQTHLDIWGGMAISLNSMKAFGLGLQALGKTYDTTQYYRFKRNVDKNARTAQGLMGEERWQPWQEKIDNAKNDDLKKVYAEVVEAYRNGEKSKETGNVDANSQLTKREANAIIRYITALSSMRGYDLGRWHVAMDKARKGEQADTPTPVDAAVLGVVAAEDEGYNTTDTEAMQDVQNEMIAKMDILAASDEGEDIIKQLDQDPMWGLRYLFENYKDTNLVKDALDYVNARSKWLGMTQRVNDDASVAEETAVAAVDQITNKKTGTIQTATLKHTGEVVNIVDGDPDSEDDLIVRGADGDLKFIYKSDIDQYGEALDAESEKKNAAAAAREAVVQAEQDKMNNTLSMQPGETLTITDGQGVEHQVAILADNNDGTLAVNIDGKQTIMAKESLQDMADEGAMLRVTDRIAQEREQRNKQQSQQTTEQQEEDLDEMPMIGEGDDMQPDYSKASPSRTHKFLYNEGNFEKADADAIVANNIAEAEAELEEAKKGRPTPKTNPIKFGNELREWKKGVDAAQKKLDYWNSVAEHEAQAQAQAQQEAQQQEVQQENTEEQPVATEGQQTQQPIAEEESPEVREEKRRQPLRNKAKALSSYFKKKVHLLESKDEITDQKVLDALAEGKYVNGWIDNKTGEVYIYLPHATTLEDVERTFFHEVVGHFGLAKLMGRERYNDFCLQVFNSMNEKQREYFLNYTGVKNIQDETKRKIKAADEFIAHTVEIADINGDMSMWDKLAAWFNEKTQHIFSSIKGRDIMYALKASQRNLQKGVSIQLNGSIDGEGESNDVGFSVSSIVEGAGFEASVADDQGNKIPMTDADGNFTIKIGDKTFNGNNPVSAEDLKQMPSAFSLLVDLSLANSDATKMTQEKADKMYQKYADIINTFLQMGLAERGGATNLEHNWLWLGDTVYRTIATNGDEQYSYSADITRVCKKNEAVIKTISEMQRRLGYGITPAQILDIYAKTKEGGYQVPCPVCYVFSRYIRNGKYASAAINGMKKYGEHLPGGNDPWTLEQWIEERDRLQLESDPKKCKDKLDEAKESGKKREIAKWEKALKNARVIDNALKDANEAVTKILDEIDGLGRSLALEKDAKKRKAIREEIKEKDKKYRAALNLISQQSLSNWIESFAIQSIDNEWQMREDAHKPENMEDFNDVALDLRRTSTAITQYPGIQRLRKSGGSAAGKEITFASNNEVGELVSGVNTGSPGESVNVFKDAANADQSSKDGAMKAAEDRFKKSMRYAAQQSLRGGQRMWSWSDNIEELMPDVAINLMQMELLGGAVQAYSKQLEGINLVASMGGYVNGSLMAKDNGWQAVSEDDIEIDENGNKVLNHDITDVVTEVDPRTKENKERTRILAAKGSPIVNVDGTDYVLMFDDVIGVSAFGRDGKEGLFSLNSKLDKAGNIIVGMNDIHVKAALADPRIFFVIPWHASGQSQHILQQMLLMLGTKMEGFVSTDYTAMQEEKQYGVKNSSGKMPVVPQAVVDFWNERTNEDAYACAFPIENGNGHGGLSETQEKYRDLRKMIFDGSIESNPKEKALVMKDEFLKQVYEYVQGMPVNEKGLHAMTSGDNKFVYPYEYWNRGTTYETADENGRRYVEYCRRLGVCPKFSGSWKNGKRDTSVGNFIDSPGYWKLLIDRRMYDVNKQFQDLTPINSDGFSVEMLDKKYNDSRFPVTEVATDQGVLEVADETMKLEEERTGSIPQVNYDLTIGKAANAYNDARGNRNRVSFSIADERVDDVMDGEGISFSAVEDPFLYAELESGEQERGYRNVVLNPDGTLGSPMAQRLGKKGAGSKSTAPFEYGRWEKSDEHPEMATEEGKIDLRGDSNVGGVDYNPYIHIRPTKVNTQFKAAWRRPDLVYVETAYPKSELTSGYHADKAKLSVGKHPWNGGELILSRYDKPIRIVPWEEVADDWIKQFGNEPIPFNIIPPGLLPVLVDKGANIGKPIGNGKALQQAYDNFKNDEEGDVSFSIVGELGSANDMAAKANLGIAKEMEMAGKDSQEIWLATGWERGADGKWRHEIPDAKAKDIDPAKAKKLSDIIDAPELFDAYPELKDYKVKFGRYAGAATFYPDTKETKLNLDYNTEFSATNEDRKKIADEAFEWAMRNNPSKRAYMKKYDQLMAERHKRRLSEEGLRTLLHEIQHAIQHIEGFSHGGNDYTMQKSFADRYREDNPGIVDFWNGFASVNSAQKLINQRVQVIRLLDSYTSKNEDEQKRIRDLGEYLKGLLPEDYAAFVRKAKAFGSEMKKYGEDGYKKLAGEVEARNVEKRNGMTEEERKNTPLSQTEDVDRASQISFSIATDELKDKGISIDNKELLDEYGLSSLTLEKSGDIVKVSKIVAKDKGNGNGTRFMNDLTDIADQNGWTLALTPDTSFGGTSVSRLKKFYNRFGFKDNKGRNTNFETRESMVRKPEGDVSFSAKGFEGGLKNEDEIWNAIENNTNAPTVKGVADLIDSIESYFGGRMVAASEGAKNALNEGLVPVADNKHSGEGGEYHHIAFENENGERFVEAVPFVKSEDVEDKYGISFSITPAEDKAYMDAVKSGDMESAQRMVTEAAKKAMPNTKVVDADGNPMVVYHDTNSTIYVNRETGENWDNLDGRKKDEWEERDDWDEHWEERDFFTFDNKNHGRQSVEVPGFFFAPVADEYHEYGNRRIAAYLNITNPIIDPDIPNRGVTNTAGRDAMEEWIRQGYDGMIRTNEDGTWDEVVAFFPNQIKSADPVTYDDEGNAIPLSERFNEEEGDIRFSIGRESEDEMLDRLVDEMGYFAALARKTMVGGGYSKKQRETYARAEWRRAHRISESIADKLNLGNDIVVVDSEEQIPTSVPMTDKQRESKGWYDPKTGKMYVILGNHLNSADVAQTLLRESVANYGLRKLFGSNFDIFLDNVLDTVTPEIRQTIIDNANKSGMKTREATEEYLARLAEDGTFTEFGEMGIWDKIKNLFKEMLHDLGLGMYYDELTDNELRYILWRSYKHLEEPQYYKSVFGIAEDIAMRRELAVGNYGVRAADRISSTGSIDISRMGTNVADNDVQLSITEPAPIFVSNAKRAVDGIKQDKATPEQWLAMITKNGGLKAGEDKWMGLSDWLKSQDKKSLTKEEVLDYIRDNQIEVQEVGYLDMTDLPTEEQVEGMQEFKDLQKQYEQFIANAPSREETEENAWDYEEKMEEKYGEDYDEKLTDEEREQLDKWVVARGAYDSYDNDEEAKRDYAYYRLADKYTRFMSAFDWDVNSDKLSISDTRLAITILTGEEQADAMRIVYTTRGLKNKKEIALVVPTIESWNMNDQVHFGDAGDGRAVAWIRFGETEIDSAMEAQAKVGAFINSADMSNLSEEEKAEFEKLKKASNEHSTKRVLVIDEIQSKRHQEGRERGYADESKIKDIQERLGNARAEKDGLMEEREKRETEIHDSEIAKQFLNDDGTIRSGMLKEWNNLLDEDPKMRELDAKISEANSRISELTAERKEALDSIPDAPFDKNWHELAMKRMLRYAAENGYDKIAWTTGAQQTDRYRLDKFIENINATDWDDEMGEIWDEEKPCKQILATDKGGEEVVQIIVNTDGRIVADVNDTYSGRQLADVVGKDVANKLMSDGAQNIKDAQLIIGSEGMKGFYDEILPRFMNKYGKKWGVKVEDITLPNVEEAGRTMHSVDVTPEMKESVMDEGQTMFRLSDGEKAQGLTFFSGGGLIEVGLADVFDPVAGVEYDEKIAGVYRDNHGNHIVTADVRDVDPMELAKHVNGKVQYFHASPVCKNFSKVKQDKGEKPLDIETAKSTAQAIDKMKPVIVTIENVAGYQNSEALKVITDKLDELGYHYDINVLNATDYGAATNRKRLILRAVDADHELPPLPEGNPENATPWYDRVEDLIDGLEETHMTESIERRLANDGIDWKNVNQPLLILGGSSNYKTMLHAWPNEPAPTITANEHEGRIIMPDGRVLKVTPRVLARLMGLPDSYKLPKSNSLATKVLGNGVPVELTNGVIAPLVREVAQAPTDEDVSFSITPGDDGHVPTLDEARVDGLFALAKKQSENPLLLQLDIVDSIKEGIVSDIAKLIQSQQEPGKNKVAELVNYTRMLLKNGFFAGSSAFEVNKILKNIEKATAKEDVMEEAKKITGIVTDNMLRTSKYLLGKQMSIRAKKTNTKGVEVMGKLSVEGQRIVAAMKEGILMDSTALSERMAKLVEDMTDDTNPVRQKNAELEHQGMVLAQAYINGVKNSIAEERELRWQKRDLEDVIYDRVLEPMTDDDGNQLVNKRTGEPRTYERKRLKPEYARNGATEEAARERKSIEEQIAAIDDAILGNKAERIDNYRYLFVSIADRLRESVEKARAFREEQKERENKIRHMANIDLEGIDAPEQEIDAKKSSFFQQLFAQPMATFNEMLRFFGRKAIDGKGELWNYFHKHGFVLAQDKEWHNYKAGLDELDAKVQEVFGEGGTYINDEGRRVKLPTIKRWGDLYDLDADMQKGSVTIKDGNRTIEVPLSQGNLLYIYMINKMADGRMKLRAMGISEEKCEEIADMLDPRFKQIADWIQDEFLPSKRIRYNEVHERMFGAPMAAIENYFPIKIAKKGMYKEIDPSQYQGGEIQPGDVTGNIIKRTKNSLPIHILTNAFDVVPEHLQKMEHWAAFGELARDLKTLLSYKTFQNKVKNMSSARFGAGEDLFDNFKAAAAMAVGSYRPKTLGNNIDRTILNVAKGVTLAKISLRLFTAFKQLMSYPAYLSEASIPELIKSTNPYGAFKSWQWAIENLPGFAERWQSRNIGDTRLEENDNEWEWWKGKIAKFFSKTGMMPNAFVDALTVSMGAKAIYETRKKEYLSLGLPEDEADKEAKLDAAIAFNETQQSSQSAYTSRMQVDRTVASTTLSLFRNSSMGYGRRMFRAINELGKKLTPGFRSECIGKMADMYERNGMDRYDAWKRARKEYNNSWVRNIVDLAVFGYGLQFAWNMASYMFYQAFGDDDDKKKENLTDALVHSAFGWAEGLAGGNYISEIGNILARLATDKRGDKEYVQKLINTELPAMPLASDIKTLVRHFGKDYVQGINDLAGLACQSLIGVNPETVTNMVVAAYDYANGDLPTAREIVLLMGRIANVPQSQLADVYLDEVGMTGEEASNLTLEELAKRYAEYKRLRNAPLAQPLYLINEGRKEELDEKMAKRFMDDAKERLAGKDEETREALFGKATDIGDIELKKLLKKQMEDEQPEPVKLVDPREEERKKKQEQAENIYILYANKQDIQDDITLDSLGKNTSSPRIKEKVKKVKSALNKRKQLLLIDTENREDAMNSLRELRRKMTDALIEANENIKK